MNKLLEKIKKWKPLDKMENATKKIYRKRILSVYHVNLPNNNLMKIPYIGKKEIVEYKSEELIALCPVTFLPDIYTITIRFIPSNCIPELKSLKYFLLDYKDIPISHEHLVSKIYKEFLKQIHPQKLYIYLQTNIRGGIITNVEIGDKI